MLLDKGVRSILFLGIIVLCLSCSEDKPTGPNNSTDFSSSSFLDEGLGVLSSQGGADVSSSSIDMTEESSSSGLDDIASSSSNKESEISSSSMEVVKESSSSEQDDIASSSSYEELDVSSSSIEMTEESSSSNDLVSSSSVVELVNSSSSLEALEESSSSSYFKSSWINLNKSIQYDTIIDSRDNQVYKILTIGEQTWMAENLNYYDTIQTPELKQHSWCFNNKESNCELYGRLYDLSVTIGYDPSETPFAQLILQSKMDSNNVQGICPDRFRIPKISDYEKITDSYNKANYLISEKDNTSGFSIPVNSNTGFRNATKFVDKEVRFWTTTYHWSSYDDADVIDFKLSSYTYGIGTGPEFGHNIRCIKK